MSEEYLICPKCGNDALQRCGKDSGSKWTNKLINRYINDAKISCCKFPLKVDKNGDLWWFTALDNWEKLGKPSKDIGYFCECGYYSLNYYDFIKNKNFLKKSNNNKDILDNDNEYIIKELEKLKKENILLKEENKKLRQNKDDFKKVTKNINELKGQINILKEEINSKENIIKELKINLSNEINKNKKIKKEKLVNFDDIIVINFLSTDQKINNYGVKCLKTDTFAEVEEKLYKEYKEFRETNNVFVFNARQILRFKTIAENKIKNGDLVQLMNFEN